MRYLRTVPKDKSLAGDIIYRFMYILSHSGAIMNSLERTLFFSISLFLVVSIVLGDTHESLAKKSVSGKSYYYVKSKPLDVDLYDTVFPVVFEFSTPNWTRPINLIGYTCTGDDYENDGWSCPVLYYWLTQIRDRLQEEIFVDNMKIRDSSKFSTGFDCNELREVFEGLYLNEQHRQEFMNFLTSSTNCQSESTIILPRSDKYKTDSAIMDAPYRIMREKFFTEYYSLQTPLNRSNDAMYTNARYNYYSSGVFDYYIESRRWSNAMTLCNDRRIPNTLITPGDLGAVLANVSEYASLNGYELAIRENKISRYYKSGEISDCAFTEDSLIVVVQVPLKRVGGKRLVEILPVPFYDDNGQVCSVNTGPGKYIVDSNEKLLTYSNWHCDTGDKGFCHLKSETEFGLQKVSCAEVLYQEEDDMTNCKVVCEDKKSFKLPMITRVADDRVLIFGSSATNSSQSDGTNDMVKISCPSFQKIELVDSSNGAVEVTLPCGCGIQNGDRVVFKAERNCGTEAHVVKVY